MITWCVCVLQYGTRQHRDCIWQDSFCFSSRCSSHALISAADAASIPLQSRHSLDSSPYLDVSLATQFCISNLKLFSLRNINARSLFHLMFSQEISVMKAFFMLLSVLHVQTHFPAHFLGERRLAMAQSARFLRDGVRTQFWEDIHPSSMIPNFRNWSASKATIRPNFVLFDHCKIVGGLASQNEV